MTQVSCDLEREGHGDIVPLRPGGVGVGVGWISLSRGFLNKRARARTDSWGQWRHKIRSRRKSHTSYKVPL